MSRDAEGRQLGQRRPFVQQREQLAHRGDNQAARPDQPRGDVVLDRTVALGESDGISWNSVTHTSPPATGLTAPTPLTGITGAGHGSTNSRGDGARTLPIRVSER